MKRKWLDITPMCPQERLAIISRITGLSFVLKRIGPLATIIIALFYLLALYLFVTTKTHKNLSISIYSGTLCESTSQHLLLLVGFDTLIYRKYYDRSLIFVVSHDICLHRILDPPLHFRSFVGQTKRLCHLSVVIHHHVKGRGLPLGENLPLGLSSASMS